MGHAEPENVSSFWDYKILGSFSIGEAVPIQANKH